MTKKSIKKKLRDYFAPRILKWLILFTGYTCRKKWIGKEYIQELQKDKKNWIYAMWHNNITLASFILRKQNLLSMASSSEDGRIAATVLELLGNRTLSGSSSRGGARVLFSMIKEIRKGQIGAVTPDGPRGPKCVLQNGIISLGQKTGIALIPFHAEATRQWIFSRSWDKHKFPKPFSTIVIGVGQPYTIPKKLDKEQFELARAEFEQLMMKNAYSVKTAVTEHRK